MKKKLQILKYLRRYSTIDNKSHVCLMSQISFPPGPGPAAAIHMRFSG